MLNVFQRVESIHETQTKFSFLIINNSLFFSNVLAVKRRFHVYKQSTGCINVSETVRTNISSSKEVVGEGGGLANSK